MKYLSQIGSWFRAAWQTSRVLVIGVVIVILGALGGVLATAGAHTAAPKAHKVAVVQRTDDTTPSTTAPTTTPTTLAPGTDPVTAANSAAGSANSAAGSAQSAAGSAQAAAGSAQQAAGSASSAAGSANSAAQSAQQAQQSATQAQAPPTTTTTQPAPPPVTYCTGSLASDQAAPALSSIFTPLQIQDLQSRNQICSDSYGAFLDATPQNDTVTGQFPLGWYLVHTN